ncbi:TIGR03087 family PEP-CTERM/XrtA system glycosyltransferase [Novosphingobium aquae]|uniref:TIGR03087 family PEP-CTERM/XrtA system glycosyltransferase n=1 Tax=Novosphingobium aquae TaxID=3133435 RepID=A0ABU8S4P1_9SPHN
MGEILFLAHRIPFPPDRGDKIRSHHVLKALAQLGPVHVATFADDENDVEAQRDLEALARTSIVSQRTKPMWRAGAEAVLRGQPVSLTAFHDAAIEQFVERTLRSRDISAIYVFSGQMGQYVPANWRGKLVIDFVDVDSAKFEAYAKSGNPAMRLINAREGRVLKAEERRLAARADTSLLVSHEEAALFASRLTVPARVEALENGIDSATFDPFSTLPDPVFAGLPGHKIVFTGQMDYAPNVAAVLRAARSLMPRIRSVIPGVQLHIIGRYPTAHVKALDGVDGCRVWGRVDSMPAYLRAADLALVPLEIARGVQNKVLEAMAMAVPVVASEGAATGIGAQHGREIMIGEDDDALVRHSIALLRDRQRAKTMGLAARRYLQDRRSWQAVLAPLPELIGMTGQGESHAA